MTSNTGEKSIIKSAYWTINVGSLPFYTPGENWSIEVVVFHILYTVKANSW